MSRGPAGEGVPVVGETLLRLAAFALGLVILLATANSLIRTLVVPRVSSSVISNAVAGGTLWAVARCAGAFRTYRKRDAIQAWGGPLVILGLLVVWLNLFWLGYALMLTGYHNLSLVSGFREAGSSLFTLGYATNERVSLVLLDFAAAATGPIVIGLMIGYLPTLYSAFSRREVEVTQLDWQAGEPNWGPELLARQSELGSLEELGELYRAWTTWAADVSETHTTYSVLIAIRSTRYKRNWVVSLLAVMDAAALQLSLMPELPAARARLVLRVGMECLRAIGAILDRDLAAEGRRSPLGQDTERPVTLSREEFDRGVRRLKRAALPITVDEDEGWRLFCLWRERYEAWAYSIALRIDAVPSWWSGPRRYVEPVIPTPEMEPLDEMGPAVATLRKSQHKPPPSKTARNRQRNRAKNDPAARKKSRPSS